MTLLHFLPVLSVVRSEKVYAFLDLYKPEPADTAALFFEDPFFLGGECGPASFVALKKVKQESENKTFSENLELLTWQDVPWTDWDRSVTNKNSSYVECGDEWKTSRCLERLNANGVKPTLIIGSHKEVATQSAALYSYINQIMYVHTTLPLTPTPLPTGAKKYVKGFNNVIRLITTDFLILKKFLEHFGWTKYLTFVSQPFVARFIATRLWEAMDNIIGSSQFLELPFYPWSYVELLDNTIDELRSNGLADHQKFVSQYFKEGTAIKNSSRSKLGN